MTRKSKKHFVSQRGNSFWEVKDCRYEVFENHLGADVEAERIRHQGAPFTAHRGLARQPNWSGTVVITAS